MPKKHFIPEGEVIYIPIGRYRFVGPTEVTLDPSFDWPVIYESGKIIHYGETKAEPKKTKQAGKLDGSSKQSDIEVGAKPKNSNRKSRRKSRSNSSVGSPTTNDGSAVGQHSDKGGEES